MIGSEVRYEAIHRVGGSGQLIGDVLKSIAVARRQAEQLGKNTSYDDWAEVVAESGEHYVEFRVEVKAPEGGSR